MTKNGQSIIIKMNQETYKPFNFINFEYEFKDTLSFVSEICEVPLAFITHRDLSNTLTITKMGFDAAAIPEDILLHNQNIIKQNTVIQISDLKKDLKYQSNLSESEFCFFAGLPILDDQNLAVGSICILDLKAKELSSAQLRSLEYAAKQLSFKLEAFEQNKVQSNTLMEQEIQFQLFIDNSKKIIYEIDVEGIFHYTSKNFRDFLGYKTDEISGKNIRLFIHPEDVEMCLNLLNDVVDTGKSEKELVYRILHKDGSYVWHASNLKFSEKKGKPIVFGYDREITELQVTKQKYLEQKEFYEKILDQIPTDIAVFDQDHKYLYLNQAALKDDELRAFIKGKDDFEYAKYTGRDESAAAKRRANFLQAVESKNMIQWEDSITSPYTGLTSYHNRKMNPVFNKNGALEMMVGFGVDITESKKIQEEILKSRQLLSSILENIAVGVVIHGPQSEFLQNNAAACEIMGVTEDQLIGKKLSDVDWGLIRLDGSNFPAEELPVVQAITLLQPVKNVVMGISRTIPNDMSWILVDAIPVLDDLGALLYVICSFTNITELKIIEDELKISNERFTYSSEAASDAIWDWDLLSNDVLVTASYFNLFGHKFKDNILKSQEWEILIHPQDREVYIANIDKALENKSITKWSAEYRYLKSDGSYADVREKAIIIRNDDKGKAIRMIGAMQDITVKKKLEDKLRHSEELFKEAFEHSPAGMALVGREGAYIEVNEKLCQILGYSNQEMKSLTFQEITFNDDLVADLKNKRSLDSGKIPKFGLEKRFIKKNKSVVWTHMSVSTVKNSTKDSYYIVQIIDISKRKKIELQNKLLIEENNANKTTQLNEVKNMYRFLAENSVDLVCLHNLEGTFQYVSPSMINILGYTPEEMEGKSPLDFVHPDDLKYITDSFYNFITEKTDDRTIARFLNTEGIYVWLETKASIVKEKNVKSGFQSSSRDVTKRKEEEGIIEKTLTKERELNELRSNLISTVSHEFRTPMTTIRTSAELIAIYLEGHSFEKKPRLEKQLSTITGEIDRIVELMNSVLTISKEDAGKTNFNPVRFDLKQLCLQVIETSFDNQMDGRKVETCIEGEKFLVFADKNLMEYSIYNVLNNAFKYSQGSGDVILKLSASASNVNLEIIDRGIGIPEEEQDKLFNTFFRASNSNGIQGTGLGLYIVKTFTEKNSGTIKLESVLGKGTTITLQFPL
jgi:PAS domain S-box-containing protein